MLKYEHVTGEGVNQGLGWMKRLKYNTSLPVHPTSVFERMGMTSNLWGPVNHPAHIGTAQQALHPQDGMSG